MLPDNIATRVAIRCITAFFDHVAPLSFAYYGLFLLGNLPVHPWISDIAKTFSPSPATGWRDAVTNFSLPLWCFLECLFYAWFLAQRKLLSQQAHTPTLPTKAERRRLLGLFISSIDDPEEFFAGKGGWMSHGEQEVNLSDIKRDNVLEWICWSFFGNSMVELQKSPDHFEEAAEILTTFEQKLYIRFEPGYNPVLHSMRLSLDEPLMEHRPLIFYAFIKSVTAVSNTTYRMLGFRPHYRNSNTQVKYWYYKGSSNDSKKRPIVFVHGIGGLFAYVPFIFQLWRFGHPIIAIEMAHVSMALVHEVPTFDDICAGIITALRRHHPSHEQDGALFIGHSLGTAVVSYLLRNHPEVGAAGAGGAILLDPVSILLHHPAVARQFIYLPDQDRVTATQLCVRFFAREQGVSYFISRHFHWFQGAMFLHSRSADGDVAHRDAQASEEIRVQQADALPPVRVFLSENDCIVPSVKIHSYLQQVISGVNEWETANSMRQSDPAKTLEIRRPSYYNGLVPPSAKLFGPTSPLGPIPTNIPIPSLVVLAAGSVAPDVQSILMKDLDHGAFLFDNHYMGEILSEVKTLLSQPGKGPQRRGLHGRTLSMPPEKNKKGLKISTPLSAAEMRQRVTEKVLKEMRKTTKSRTERKRPPRPLKLVDSNLSKFTIRSVSSPKMSNRSLYSPRISIRSVTTPLLSPCRIDSAVSEMMLSPMIQRILSPYV